MEAQKVKECVHDWQMGRLPTLAVNSRGSALASFTQSRLANQPCYYDSTGCYDSTVSAISVMTAKVVVHIQILFK